MLKKQETIALPAWTICSDNSSTIVQVPLPLISCCVYAGELVMVTVACMCSGAMPNGRWPAAGAEEVLRWLLRIQRQTAPLEGHGRQGQHRLRDRIPECVPNSPFTTVRSSGHGQLIGAFARAGASQSAKAFLHDPIYTADIHDRLSGTMPCSATHSLVCKEAHASWQ